MEYGKMKFNLCRPLSLVFLVCVFVIGLTGIWWWGTGGLAAALNNEISVTFFIKVIVVIFLFFGGLGFIETFRCGIAYTQIVRYKLEELDSSLEYSNGLMVVFKDYAEFLTCKYKKVLERGYVRILIKYNRKKEEIGWEFLDY